MIDVSEILDRPAFCKTVQLVRRPFAVDEAGNVQEADQYGRNSMSESAPVNIQAVVLPGPGKMLTLFPAAAQLSDLKRVYSKTPLFAQSASGDADIIIDGNVRYQVYGVAQYGHCQALCSLESASV